MNEACGATNVLFNLVPRVLSLLRESTLVAAGHVSARADSRDVIEGRSWTYI